MFRDGFMKLPEYITRKRKEGNTHDVGLLSQLGRHVPHDGVGQYSMDRASRGSGLGGDPLVQSAARGFRIRQTGGRTIGGGVLRQRYARGEIDTATFEQMRERSRSTEFDGRHVGSAPR